MDQIEQCISFIIGKASQTVSRRARELLAPFQITPPQYAVLKAISETEAATAARLIQRLSMDTATVTGILDRLEANTWLRRIPHNDDRRIQVLELSAKADQQLPALDEAMDTLNREMRQLIGTDAEAVWRGLDALNPKTGRI